MIVFYRISAWKKKGILNISMGPYSNQSTLVNGNRIPKQIQPQESLEHSSHQSSLFNLVHSVCPVEISLCLGILFEPLKGMLLILLKIYSFFHCSTLELLCTLRRSKNVGSSKAKWLVEGFPQPFLQLRKSREGMNVWVSSFDSFSCKMKIFVISRQNSCNTIHNPEFKRLSPAKTALLFYWHAFSFQNRHKAAVKSQVLACIRYQPIISGISPGLGWTESYHVEVAFTWLKLTDSFKVKFCHFLLCGQIQVLHPLLVSPLVKWEEVVLSISPWPALTMMVQTLSHKPQSREHSVKRSVLNLVSLLMHNICILHLIPNGIESLGSLS